MTPRHLSPVELRQLALAACPELATAFALAERVAGLNPDSEQPCLSAVVGEARAIVNGHTPRDVLRESHKELQERLAFMLAEYGRDLAERYPGTARITREQLDAARRINPPDERPLPVRITGS